MHSFSVTSANIAVNYILLQTRFFWLHFYLRKCGSSCNKVDVVSFQMWRIQCNHAKWRPFIRCSRSFKDIDFGTNRKLVCDFILVNNTNIRPTLHCFHVIAYYWSNFSIRQGYLSLTHFVGGDPLNLRVWNLSPETTNIALSNSEKFTSISWTV